MIKLTLYDKNDRPVRELKRETIRWGTLKKAVLMQGGNADPDEQLEELIGIIAEVFDGLATAEEIERGANAVDIMECVGQIVDEAVKLKTTNFRKGTAARKG